MSEELQGRVDDAEEKAILFHRLAAISGEAGDMAAAAAADRKVIQRKALLQTHIDQQAQVDAQTAPHELAGK